MFQGTMSWAFFHVSKGSVSVLGAGWEEDTQPEKGTPVPLGREGDPRTLRALSLRRDHQPP